MDKHLDRPHYKIQGTIPKVDEGVTLINGPEKKNI